jgi:hypothetical protein
MSSIAALVVALALPAAEPQAKEAPARVTLTAELACLHCTFGEGDGCAVCLKLDDRTPILLAGKVAKQFEKDNLSKKVVVIEGVLSVKDRKLLLTADAGRFGTDADKDRAPAKGQARVVGQPCCGMCDLMLCDACILAIRNAAFPLVLDGKLAFQHAEQGKEAKSVTTSGTLFLDKTGLLRLRAASVTLEKK